MITCKMPDLPVSVWHHVQRLGSSRTVVQLSVSDAVVHLCLSAFSFLSWFFFLLRKRELRVLIFWLIGIHPKGKSFYHQITTIIYTRYQLIDINFIFFFYIVQSKFNDDRDSLLIQILGERISKYHFGVFIEYILHAFFYLSKIYLLYLIFFVNSYLVQFYFLIALFFS